MEYRNVRFPADFLDDLKEMAKREYRPLSQQIMYLATIGKKTIESETILSKNDMSLIDIEEFKNRMNNLG